MPETRLPAVLFDFDGTLISGDSTDRWLRMQFQTSWLRTALGGLLAPLALLMLKHEAWRLRGVSLLLWAATLGRNAEALEASFQSFAGQFGRKELKLAWNESVCAELDAALQRSAQVQPGTGCSNQQVVVVTASPQHLAEAMLRVRWPHLTVLGSSLKPAAYGWIGDFYCRGAAKLQALSKIGMAAPFAAVYSDSSDDWPLFANAEHRVFVGKHAKSLQLLAVRGLAPHQHL